MRNETINKSKQKTLPSKQNVVNMTGLELLALKQCITLFRLCPAISFQQSLAISENLKPIESHLKVLQEKQDLLISRRDTAIKDAFNDLVAKEWAKGEYENALNVLQQDICSIEVKKVDKATFIDLPIDGYATAPITLKMENGEEVQSEVKYSYRQMFYSLVEAGIIV